MEICAPSTAEARGSLIFGRNRDVESSPDTVCALPDFTVHRGQGPDGCGCHPVHGFYYVVRASRRASSPLPSPRLLLPKSLASSDLACGTVYRGTEAHAGTLDSAHTSPVSPLLLRRGSEKEWGLGRRWRLRFNLAHVDLVPPDRPLRQSSDLVPSCQTRVTGEAGDVHAHDHLLAHVMPRIGLIGW